MSLNNIQQLEKLVNSELTSKVKESLIEFNELLIETNLENLIEVIQFLKANDNCKFKQLIDIAGVDYPKMKIDFIWFIFFFLMN